MKANILLQTCYHVSLVCFLPVVKLYLADFIALLSLCKMRPVCISLYVMICNVSVTSTPE